MSCTTVKALWPSERPADDNTCSCATCGYAWQRGQHGGHSCATHLSKKIAAASERVDLLNRQLESLRAAFAAAKKFIDVSPCDPDIDEEQARAWIDYQEALERLQPPAQATTPCGGCGESDPHRRCLGCRHQFSVCRG